MIFYKHLLIISTISCKNYFQQNIDVNMGAMKYFKYICTQILQNVYNEYILISRNTRNLTLED